VELAISWPVMLHNSAPLQLIVSGRIVRSNGTRAGVRMVQHEFRTIGSASELRLNAAAAGKSTLTFLQPRDYLGKLPVR